MPTGQSRRTTLKILITWEVLILMVKQCQDRFSGHEKAVEMRKLQRLKNVMCTIYFQTK
jgi:hypothetical protein